MRFASAGKFSANDYAPAGRSAANSLVQSFAAARENAPDWTGLARTSMATRSAERQTAMKVEGDIATAGVRAVGNVKNAQIKGAYDLAAVKTKLDGQKSARKAGRLAGLGGLGRGMGKKPRKKATLTQEQIDAQYEVMRRGLGTADEQSKFESQPFDENKSYDGTDAGNAIADNYLSGDNGTSGKDSLLQGQTPSFNPPEQGATPWSRLSRVIRYGEGTQGDAGYRTQFTGKQFSDLSRHPRQINSSNGLSSDAAGAYQFLSTTWDGAKKALNLKDFSPESQEKAGRYLTQQRGVNPDQAINNINDFKSVMDKLAPEWASLPYSGVSPTGHGRGSSYYGQGGKRLEELWSLYKS